MSLDSTNNMTTTDSSGVLLVNIGTPEEATLPAVRRYLRQFLSDPKVLNIPSLVRWILVNLIIVPFRAPKSLHAYQAVWTKEGSPLLAITRRLVNKLNTKAGSRYKFEIGMRYAKPSIEDGVKRLIEQGCREITVLPLYPQYSDSATGSSIEESKRVFKKLIDEQKASNSAEAVSGSGIKLKITQDFYELPSFVEAQAALVQIADSSFKADHVLMSYHGLPESHVKATDPSGRHCLASGNCCDSIGVNNQKCYRAHSFATSRLLAKKLGLSQDQYSVSFQSRLSGPPWIRPFTDLILTDLRAKGFKRLLVVCPSFVIDCLETLEEIGMRCREDWQELGGEDFTLVPCVNDSELFLECVQDLVVSAKEC
jgi:ferrochelatase